MIIKGANIYRLHIAWYLRSSLIVRMCGYLFQIFMGWLDPSWLKSDLLFASFMSRMWGDLRKHHYE